MADMTWTTPSVPMADTKFNGGLNSTAAPLNLKDNESSDLSNVDFDKFGSIIKRNGYTILNADTGNTVACDGLFWFVYASSGSITRNAIRVYNSKIERMDDLDGTWDDITGGVSITLANHCDFEAFNNKLFVTNGYDLPFQVVTSGTAGVASVPTGLTLAKYVKVFQNYLFYANVAVGGTYYPTRIYWSAIRDDTTWDLADWIEVSKDDGQPITGLKVLSNALVVFKTNSIYNIYFTGDPDIPFTMQKSNSPVGCLSFTSIQEVENGLAFISADGFYYYDGTSSTKISDKINTTLADYSKGLYSGCRSVVYRTKNRVIWSLNAPTASTNILFVWDYYNNAWSKYLGFNASAMAIFMVDGVEERPYFQGRIGMTYRMDSGYADYINGNATDINAYYYTNWKAYNDLVNQKGVPHVYVYYTTEVGILTVSYSYEFELGDTYSQSFDTQGVGEYWDIVVWDTGKWLSTGGAVKRIDLTGRGRVIRFKFANISSDGTFRVDAFGSFPHLEANA